MNREEINQAISHDINEAVKGTITDAYVKELRLSIVDSFEKETSVQEILKRVAFASQAQFKSRIEQGNLGFEYTELLSNEKKIEYLEAGKKEEYYELISKKKEQLKEEFKKTVEQSITIELGHKELEKRLGIDFELGQNPYMVAYLSTLIKEE